MQSFTLCGSDQATRASYIQDLLSSQIELIHLVAEKTSLTIKQIQELNGPLSIEARLPRIVWIEEANLLTIPAQNALLKMLEEPPTKTDFYLTCQSKTSLLPTIISRTKVISLQTNNETPDPSVLTELKRIMTLTPGDRLMSIVKRDRSESLLWLSQIETALKLKFRDPSLNPKGASTMASIAKLVQNAHTQLLANCAVGLVTQNFYLLLPHTHSAN